MTFEAEVGALFFISFRVIRDYLRNVKKPLANIFITIVSHFRRTSNRWAFRDLRILLSLLSLLL